MDWLRVRKLHIRQHLYSSASLHQYQEDCIGTRIFLVARDCIQFMSHAGFEIGVPTYDANCVRDYEYLAAEQIHWMVQVIGYIIFTCNRLNVHISKIAIDKNHRRRGHARELVQVDFYSKRLWPTSNKAWRPLFHTIPPSPRPLNCPGIILWSLPIGQVIRTKRNENTGRRIVWVFVRHLAQKSSVLCTARMMTSVSCLIPKAKWHAKQAFWLERLVQLLLGESNTIPDEKSVTVCKGPDMAYQPQIILQ